MATLSGRVFSTQCFIALSKQFHEIGNQLVVQPLIVRIAWSKSPHGLPRNYVPIASPQNFLHITVCKQCSLYSFLVVLRQRFQETGCSFLGLIQECLVMFDPWLSFSRGGGGNLRVCFDQWLSFNRGIWFLLFRLLLSLKPMVKRACFSQWNSSQLRPLSLLCFSWLSSWPSSCR